MRHVVSAMLVISGIIHLLPLSGVLGGYNTQIARVVVADIVALVCLLIALVFYVVAWKDLAIMVVHE